MADKELIDFINYKMDQLGKDVQRLAVVVEAQGASLRAIEITTTTRLTELRKDIDNAFNEIRDLREDQKKMADSQKMHWRYLEEERDKEKAEMGKRWEDQIQVNQGISTLTKLLWAILGIVLSILLGFAWQLLVHGGLPGLIGS